MILRLAVDWPEGFDELVYALRAKYVEWSVLNAMLERQIIFHALMKVHCLGYIAVLLRLKIKN
jgi:hypothetical protein